MPTTEKLIFSQTFEGLFRAAGDLITDDTIAKRLKELGLDPTRALRPAYPLAAFLQTVALLGERLSPGEPPAEQARKLGRQFIDGYRQTMVGQAMVTVMRVLGPHRTLERLSRQFRTGNNFSETKVTRVDVKGAELWCNQVTVPGWYQGLLERGLELAGAKEVAVSLDRLDDSGATFRITWL